MFERIDVIRCDKVCGTDEFAPWQGSAKVSASVALLPRVLFSLPLCVYVLVFVVNININSVIVCFHLAV